MQLDLNYKQHDATVELKEKNKQSIISGYAAVFNQKDSQGDIILRGAFKNAEQEKVKFLWQHDAKVPIGKIRKLYEDHYGLYVEVEMILDVAAAREAHSLVKSGAISGLSIGFKPMNYFYEEDTTRIIEEIDLWEISLVTFPANNLAEVTAVKSDGIAKLSMEIDLAINILDKIGETYATYGN